MNASEPSAAPTQLAGTTGVYQFRNYTIEITKSVLWPYARLLASSQANAITKGVLQEVKKHTWVCILGFLQGDTPMVCIIMNLPPHSIELPKNVFSFTLSLVKESESIIAATMITTPEDLKKIDSDKRKLSLPELDADYHPVLECVETLQLRPTSQSTYLESSVRLTQEHHNILYALYYLAPFTWTRFLQQLSILDEITEIRRDINFDAVVGVQKYWNFMPLSSTSDDTVMYPSGHFEASLKFEVISGSSDEAKAQRALINSAKHRL